MHEFANLGGTQPNAFPDYNDAIEGCFTWCVNAIQTEHFPSQRSDPPRKLSHHAMDPAVLLSVLCGVGAGRCPRHDCGRPHRPGQKCQVLQAEGRLAPGVDAPRGQWGLMNAYATIVKQEGMGALWTARGHPTSRNAIGECGRALASYDRTRARCARGPEPEPTGANPSTGQSFRRPSFRDVFLCLTAKQAAAIAKNGAARCTARACALQAW